MEVHCTCDGKRDVLHTVELLKTYSIRDVKNNS